MCLKGVGSVLVAGLISSLLPAGPAAGEEGKPAGEAEASAAKEPEHERYPELDSLFALYQPYVANISAYEPIYFLVGAEPEESKFQISLKYRFLNPEGSLSTRFPWLQGFHLGYTQTSFWNLAHSSAPFEDTSYKPELFYRSSNIGLRPSWLQGLFLQTGVQHESNGRGDDLSRSTNFFYAEPMAVIYNPASRYGLLLGFRAQAYLENDNENSDLRSYRGSYELNGTFGKADGWVLGSALRWAHEGVSVQVDLTYPIHKILQENISFYFHAQFVSALAESLLDYQERTDAARFGFSVVR